MGALLTKFRGKRPSSEGVVESKDESENVESPQTQQAAEPPEKECNKQEQAIKVENIEQEDKKPETVEPTVKELDRVRETKLEKEKTVNDSGETKQKTVFTEYQESVRVEQAKGRIADPFETSNKSLFPSFSELKSSSSKDSSLFTSNNSSTRPTSLISQTSSEIYHPIQKEELIKISAPTNERDEITVHSSSSNEKDAPSQILSSALTTAPTLIEKEIRNKTNETIQTAKTEAENTVGEIEAEVREIQRKAEEKVSLASSQIKTKSNEVKDTLAEAKKTTEQAVENKTNEVQQKVQEVSSSVEKAVGDGKSAIENKASEAKESLEQVESKARETLVSAQSQIQNKAQQVEEGWQRTQRDVQAKVQGLQSQAENTKSSVTSKVETTIGKAESTVQEVKAKGEEEVARIGTQLQSKAEETEEKIRENVSTATIQLQSKVDQVKSDIESGAQGVAIGVQSHLQSGIQTASDQVGELHSKAQNAATAATNKVEDIRSTTACTISSTATNLQSKVQETEKNIQSGAEELVQSTKLQLSEAEMKLKETQSKTEDALASANAQLKSKVTGVEESLKDAGNRVQSTVTEVNLNFQNKAAETAGGVQNRAQEVVTHVQNSVEGIVSQGQGTAEDYIQQIQSKAQELTSGLNLSRESNEDISPDVNDAVVKIQAGIRGYLTRKSLKEKKEKGSPFDAKESIGTTEAKDYAITDSQGMENLLTMDNETFAKTLALHSEGEEENIQDEPLPASALIDFLDEGVSQLTEEELSWLQEGNRDDVNDQELAATKIQAAFRGYKVRKDKKK